MMLLTALACAQFFAGGVAPTVPRPVEIVCKTGYAAAYDPAAFEPAYSAEEMTADSVRAGEAVHRFGNFFAFEGAKPSDYDKAGYDRGHMVNADDRGADKAETFCMCNMVPQKPDLNRKVWLAEERRLRAYAVTGVHLFVVTGPLAGPNPTRLKGKEIVPIATWKAIYAVGRGVAALICSNGDKPACVDEPMSTLQGQLLWNPLPGVPAADRHEVTIP